MDFIVILIWLIFALTFLFGVIGCSYYALKHQTNRLWAIVKIILALLVFGTLTLFLGSLADLTLMAGAHANPPGPILNTKGLVIGVILTVFYASIAWLTCSFLIGRMILPQFGVTEISTE